MADGSSSQVEHLKVENGVQETNDRNRKLLQCQRDSGYFSPVTPGTTPGTTPDNAAPKTKILRLEPQAYRSNSSPSAVSDGSSMQKVVTPQVSGKKGLQRTLSSPGALDSATRSEVSAIIGRTMQLALGVNGC